MNDTHRDNHKLQRRIPYQPKRAATWWLINKACSGGERALNSAGGLLLQPDLPLSTVWQLKCARKHADINMSRNVDAAPQSVCRSLNWAVLKSTAGLISLNKWHPTSSKWSKSLCKQWIIIQLTSGRGKAKVQGWFIPEIHYTVTQEQYLFGGGVCFFLLKLFLQSYIFYIYKF